MITLLLSDVLLGTVVTVAVLVVVVEVPGSNVVVSGVPDVLVIVTVNGVVAVLVIVVLLGEVVSMVVVLEAELVIVLEIGVVSVV